MHKNAIYIRHLRKKRIGKAKAIEVKNIYNNDRGKNKVTSK